jgi:two-component system, sensor histidine kinase FlrB
VSGLPGVKKTAVWTLLITCTAFVAIVAWSLVSLSISTKDQEARVRNLVQTVGRSMAQQAVHGAFQWPGASLKNWAQPQGGDPSAIQLRPLQAALLFHGRLLWSFPPGAPPAVKPPFAGGDQVTRDGELWVYSATLEDGRLFVATFEAPAYQRSRTRHLLLGSFVLVGMAALVCLWCWLVLRLYRSYQSLEGSVGEAGKLLPSVGQEAASQAMVNLFQKTLQELKARTAELEQLHRQERRRAEDVEGLAEALSANLEAGILRFSGEGELTGVNAKARILLGLPRVPRLGDRYDALLKSRSEVLQVLEEARESCSLSMRDEVPGAPGILLQVAAIPLFNLTHQLREYLVILRDLTPFYQMKKTLREREALSRLGEVAAGVTHEVRNTLSTVSAQLKLLAQDNPGLASDPHFVGLGEETRKLELVMQNLLFFAKPIPILKEGISLREFLREAADSVRTGFPGVTTVVDCIDGLRVEADREALARALRNLTRNAAEAVGDSGGVIRLSAGREGHRMLVRVEDDGPGIPEEALPTLYVPFSSQKPGGTGLGLAIARKIAREHGGDLYHEVSPLGGACFILALPIEPVGNLAPVPNL